MIRGGGRRGNAKWGAGGYTEANPEGRAMTETATDLDWDTLPETVRDFLTAAAGGTVVKRAGMPVGRWVPIKPPPTDDGEWTSAKNQRRCDLIDRDIDGTVTPEELQELDGLTHQLRRYVDRVAPLRLEPLRKLHQELLDKAAAAAQKGEPA